MKKFKIWIGFSIVLIIVLSIITKSSLIQIIASVCGVIYVFSTAIENKYGQFFGMVNSLLYGYIMYKTAVYGTAIYDIVYCVPMQIYTFFTWGKDKNGSNKTIISRYTNRQRMLIMLFTSLVIVIYYLIAVKLKVSFALIDGISIILGIMGLYMTSKKKIEQWICFIVSNISMITLWTIQCIENISNIPMLLMWLIYLVNNTIGLFSWNKKLKETGTAK